MTSALTHFEKIVRKARGFGRTKIEAAKPVHPFDERNVHPDIAEASRGLFDNGHYSQATFEAFKLLDKEVSIISGIKESGYKLMMAAFAENNSPIQLTPLSSTSEVDEQKGFQFMFAGSVWAIRNPRGHEVNLPDPIDRCLDHLSVASVLLRRLEGRVAPWAVDTTFGSGTDGETT